MIVNRREYLRQQRMRRRRRFFLCCLIFIIIILILLGILISRIVSSGSSDDPATDPQTTTSANNNPDSAPTSAAGSDSSQSSDLQNSDPAQTEESSDLTPQLIVPAGYELLQLTETDMHQGNLILINKDHKYLYSGQQSMTSMYDLMNYAYSVSDLEVAMIDAAAQPLHDMLNGFYDYTGLDTITILCGYRSEEKSQELFDQSVAENGLEHATWYTMPPGHSEHQAALAADFWITYYDYSEEFTGQGEYAWFGEHCHEYGFILRYQDAKKEITQIAYEPWHFRYLGVPNATAVANTGLCYEEYIDFIKNYRADGEHYQVSTADGNYEIYYAPGLQVPVPTGQSYEISGNNVDGFIVTVKVS